MRPDGGGVQLSTIQPDILSVAWITPEHELTDHDVRGISHPGTGSEPSIAVCGRGIGCFQPECVGRTVCRHISNGVDPVGSAKGFRPYPRPNDVGDQRGAVLRNTQLAVVGIKMVLNCQIAGAQVFQNRRVQGTICRHSFALCYIQLIPCAIAVAKNNPGKKLFNGIAAVRFIADDIGGCLGLSRSAGC